MIRFSRPRPCPSPNDGADREEVEEEEEEARAVVRSIFPPTVFTDANYTRGILLPNHDAAPPNEDGNEDDDDDEMGPLEEVSIPVPLDYFAPDHDSSSSSSSNSDAGVSLPPYRYGPQVEVVNGGGGGRRLLPILTREEVSYWNHGIAAHAAAGRRHPMEANRLLGTITLKFDEYEEEEEERRETVKTKVEKRRRRRGKKRGGTAGRGGGRGDAGGTTGRGDGGGGGGGSLREAAQKYGDQYRSKYVAKKKRGSGGCVVDVVARRPSKAHDRFARSYSKKQAREDAFSEMEEEDDASADESSSRSREDRRARRLEERSERIFARWRDARGSPPLRECWDCRAGGFVREALQTNPTSQSTKKEEEENGDDDDGGGGEFHVPIVCLREWMRGDGIADPNAGRTKSLYGGLRRIPTDAASVLDGLLDLSCPTSLYKIPLITPYAVARRIAASKDDRRCEAAGTATATASISWRVRIGVYMNRLLPEVLTAGTLHSVMSALDEGSYVVSEPLHLPPMRNGDDPVFESCKYPIVRLPGSAEGCTSAIVDLTEEEEEDDAREEKKEEKEGGAPSTQYTSRIVDLTENDDDDDDDDDREEKKEEEGYDAPPRDRSMTGATRETKTISPFTPEGLLKLMESVGNDVSRYPEIAASLAPYLKLDLMLHQRHAVCWMTQMESLGGFGINSILWEERTFLDGGKYYYSPALGQIRLGRPPVTVGGCVADMMGLGKTLQMLCLVASSLDAIKREAREGGEGCTHATLIVVPPALVTQWCNEIEKSCGDSIEVDVLDANNDRTDRGLVQSGGRGADVVITTYNALERPAAGRYLASYRWGRIVLDEQQNVRSSTTTVARNCEGLDCHRRWMLSGTPIFEGIEDLRGELNFLRLVPFGAYSEDGFFDFSVTNHWERRSVHGLETLRILGLLILRRSKDMTIRQTGRPIMDQRKLTVEVVPVAQSASERALYCWFEFLVSRELQRKTDDGSNAKKHLKSRALCLRLLREICFSAVMINGGLGVSSQLKTLNTLVRKMNSRDEEGSKKSDGPSSKKRRPRKVMSPPDALKYLSQHERSANVGAEFVSDQQFSRGQGANSRANHAMEGVEDQVKRARTLVDESARKEAEAIRKRAKAHWHLALELITTGALGGGDERLAGVSPKWSSLWKWRQLCIALEERDGASGIAPCLRRGWRPSSSFKEDLLAANPGFAWAHQFSLRLDNIPFQVSIDDIASALFESSKDEPRARLKLEQLHKSLNKANDPDKQSILSDITDAESALQKAVSFDQQLQPPTVFKIASSNPSITENWRAYVQVSGEEVQQQLIRQSDSAKGIILKSTDAIPHIQAALDEATECYSQAEAEQNVHPCAANKKKKAESKKALEKAKRGLTINFDSTSLPASTTSVTMSRSMRSMRGNGPQTRSALVEAAGTAIVKNTASLATARSRLEINQSILDRLGRALSRGVSQDISQKSAFETLESLRTNDFESTMCPICQCHFGSGGEDATKPVVAMTTCGHFFCISCLDHHVHVEMGKNKPVTCPVCRAGFNPSFDVIHIDHLANDDKENEERRNDAKANVREASGILATSEGILNAELWHSLFLSIDVPTHVSSAAHHLHTALPRDALAHMRAATEMKLDCARSDKPPKWEGEAPLQNTNAGLSSKIQALLRDLPVGEHAVVFSSSKEGVLHLQTVIKAKGISCFSLFTGQQTKKTEESVSFWDTTKTDASKIGPVLVVQAGAAASGLTLTRSSKLFLLEPFSRQEEEQQAYARLHRYGQKHDVHVKIYYAPVSVESRLLFWRKRSSEKMTASGNSSSYIFTQQLFEEEEEDSDTEDRYDDKANMIDSTDDENDDVSMREEDSAEAGGGSLRTQFLLGLVDEDGNPTNGAEGDDHTNDVDPQDAAYSMSSTRRFVLD